MNRRQTVTHLPLARQTGWKFERYYRHEIHQDAS